VKLTQFSGDQVVQVTNPDPFARPVLRSPVMHTPLWLAAAAQLIRWLWHLARFAARHPIADLVIAGLALAWRYVGWPGPVLIAAVLIAGSVTWQLAWPASWSRIVTGPALARWRHWHYQRQWPAVMTIARLAVHYRGRILLPLLGPVTTTGYTDRLHVRLVAGQSPDDFAVRADNLAHGFGAIACRIRTAFPGVVIVELVRRDALAAASPHCRSLLAPICGPSGGPPRRRHPVVHPPPRQPRAAGRRHRGRQGIAAVGHHPRYPPRARRQDGADPGR
jgi:S-DNA-T family DNA segregation ATPase FtsK/SpoIIIE